MLLIMPVFPDQPSCSYEITLEDASYRARFIWRARQRSWYLDLWTQAGDALALGRRLSPGFLPITRVVADLPPGVFYVWGTDGYTQADLGNLLQLYYLPSDSIEPAPATDAPVVELT